MVKRILSAALLVLFTTGSAHAIPLSNLFNGQSITAGDKLFDNWTLRDYTSSDGRTFDADNIEVTALNDGGLDPGPGLRFSVLNGELTVTGDDIFAFVDLMFGFRVTVLDPTLRIKDNTLAYTPDLAMLQWLSDGSFDLGTYIIENIDTSAILANPGDVGDLGTKNIQFSQSDQTTGQVAKLTDNASFAPQDSIWVTKNILVWAVDSTDTAQINGFEQRFSQTTVPEPATLWLAALGAAGLGFTRRRRR